MGVTPSVDKVRKPRSVGGPELGRTCGGAAKRLAAAILEVLAGVRTPAEAATATGLSLQRYYQVETRALQGLLEACEPRPRGRMPLGKDELAALQRENEKLRQEVGRQQALTRAAQRAVGLAPPARPATKPDKKTRRRKTVRALSVAARLLKEEAGPVPSVSV